MNRADIAWLASRPAVVEAVARVGGDPYAVVDAYRTAETLMEAAGLGDWKLRVGTASLQSGSVWFNCVPGTRLWDGKPGRLTLSGPLMSVWTPAQRQATILHEIAHALCPDDGHGRIWRDWCRRFGIKPSRLWGEDGERRIA